MSQDRVDWIQKSCGKCLRGRPPKAPQVKDFQEINSINDRDRLAAYPFYSAAIGELEFRRGRHKTAREHFRAALALARNPMERRFLEQRVGACERDNT